MSTSSGKPLLVVIRRSKLSAGDEGRRICTEFKQAKYPFKWRRYMCARCGVLRDEHSASKSKVSAGDEGGHIAGKSKLSAGDEGEHIAGKSKLSAGDEGAHIACKSKHSAGDGGEHDTDKSKLSAEEEGERSANKSKISAGEKGERVCTEFKQAKYPYKWRKYMCARCGVHRSEHSVSKAKAKAKVDNDMENIREEHLPPRKRLILRFKRSQARAAAAVAASREKENKEGELEEGEITWSPGSTIAKGKRAPRRKR